MFGAAVAVFCAPARAHDGAHVPNYLERVDSANRAGKSVDIVLTLTRLSGSRILHTIDTPGAAKVAAGPVLIPFALDVPVVAQLEFDEQPPDVFMLRLDFGAIGEGRVHVTPTPALK